MNDCKHCGRPIRRHASIWVHDEDGLATCIPLWNVPGKMPFAAPFDVHVRNDEGVCIECGDAGGES